MIIKIEPNVICYKREIQNLCKAPYWKHPKGCPNYGVKEGCPPNMPLINEVLDFKKGLYLIYTEFDIGTHAKRMQRLHPDWSKRQLYCRLYWQPRARKLQRAEEAKAVKKYGLTKIISLPEAYGVNVTKLMRNAGIKLEWPPRKIARVVSLGGYDKKSKLL